MKGIKNIITKEQLCAVGNFIKESSRIVIPIVGCAIFSETGRELLEKIRYSGNMKYDDAVKAITNSNMMSSDKAKVLTSLKKDGDSEFYKGVINTVTSSMFSSDKVETVLSMCENK